MSFNGFPAETFRFLFEIAFNNNIEWFNANKERYELYLKKPMHQLASELMPTALRIDGGFSTNLNTTVSRIRRDTRFTTDKSPYRSNMWIGYRYPNTSVSEGLTPWFQMSPNGYEYGIGFYSASTKTMDIYRKKLISDPDGFIALAQPLVDAGFLYDSVPYKKDRFPDAPQSVKAYINVKSFSWRKGFDGVSDLIAPSDIAERLEREFMSLKPMYDYINGACISHDSEMPLDEVD